MYIHKQIESEWDADRVLVNISPSNFSELHSEDSNNMMYFSFVILDFLLEMDGEEITEFTWQNKWNQ